jgi:hypothetical protein
MKNVPDPVGLPWCILTSSQIKGTYTAENSELGSSGIVKHSTCADFFIPYSYRKVEIEKSWLPSNLPDLFEYACCPASRLLPYSLGILQTRYSVSCMLPSGHRLRHSNNLRRCANYTASNRMWHLLPKWFITTPVQSTGKQVIEAYLNV